MKTIFGVDSFLFQNYVAGRKMAIFPWSLSIVDCFFLNTAFRFVASRGSTANDGKVELKRISNGGRQIEPIAVRDAFDLYDIDSDSDGVEVVLRHEESGSLCYWDVHERFVLAVGDESFLQLARPFPADIERHRFLESMVHLSESGCSEPAELIYETLVARGE